MDASLIAALVVASLLIGATGTWSPCGFSMVDTIGPTGHTGGRSTTLAACATFFPGALVGAVFTFGGLSLIGGLIPGEAGWLSYSVAVGLALIAAFAEARGTRIAPQIRRQLPEHWRRIMPMPVAAALYGILLGLGFTTFVLTFGVWALAGIAFALGEPIAGLAIGLGFGVGRAIPVVTLAPFADKPFGRKAITLMAERPELYRRIRLGDAVALLGAAGALLFAGTAKAAPDSVKGASDPQIAGDTIAYANGPDDNARYDEGSGPQGLPGTDPSISADWFGVLDGDDVIIISRDTLLPVSSFPAAGVDAISLSDNWIVYRTRKGADDRLYKRKIRDNGETGDGKKLALAKKPTQLGLPSVDDNQLVYAAHKRTQNKINYVGLSGNKKKSLLSSKTVQLSNPSINGDKIVFVLGTGNRYELRIRSVGGNGSGRTLLRSKKRLWSTALSSKRAYVTYLTGSNPNSRIKSVRP